MGGRTTSFTKFTITSTFTTIFGITSVLVGIAQSCAWLGVMGVITFLGTPKPYTVDRTYGPVSGHALGLMAASGLWCGIWVAMTGICGCCFKKRNTTAKNVRVKHVVCIASVINSFLFCPVQIALCAYLFKAEIPWVSELHLQTPVIWAIILQSAGIAAGIGSLICSIVFVIVACRTTPYEGQQKEWNEFDL